MDFDSIRTVADFWRNLETTCPCCRCDPEDRERESRHLCHWCGGSGRVLSDEGKRFLRRLYEEFERQESVDAAWKRIGESLSEAVTAEFP